MRTKIAIAGAFASLLGGAGTSLAASPDDLAEGGRLYDKWWAEYGLQQPAQAHPAYPASGKQSGANTWRCKECHGWDYRGAAGAYQRGGHATGIKGIRRFAGGDPRQVLAILKDTTHRYDTVMRDRALGLIAGFVVEGQLDTTAWVDGATKQVRADATKGKALFDDKCARCHGADGRNLNFKTRDKPEYVGTVARKNPWELLHKIRNGHPGSAMPMGPGMMGRWRPNEGMPHMRELPTSDQAAIAAYTQTLPMQ